MPRSIHKLFLPTVVAVVFLHSEVLAQPNSPTWVLGDDQRGVWECIHAGRVIGSLTISSDVAPGHVVAYGAAFDKRNVLLSVFSLEYTGVDNAGMSLILTQGVADQRARRSYAETIGKMSKEPGWAKEAPFRRSAAAWLAGAGVLHNSNIAATRQVRLPTVPTTFNLDAWAISEILGDAVPQVRLGFVLKDTQLITSVAR